MFPDGSELLIMEGQASVGPLMALVKVGLVTAMANTVFTLVPQGFVALTLIESGAMVRLKTTLMKVSVVTT